MDRRPIPIAEQLPDAGADVLAYCETFGWWQAQYFPGDGDADAGWQFVGLEDVTDRTPVTHWLQMPRVPR